MLGCGVEHRAGGGVLGWAWSIGLGVECYGVGWSIGLGVEC